MLIKLVFFSYSEDSSSLADSNTISRPCKNYEMSLVFSFKFLIFREIKVLPYVRQKAIELTVSVMVQEEKLKQWPIPPRNWFWPSNWLTQVAFFHLKEWEKKLKFLISQNFMQKNLDHFFISKFREIAQLLILVFDLAHIILQSCASSWILCLKILKNQFY